MDGVFSLEDLTRRTGASIDDLRDWLARGMLVTADDGRFTADAPDRVHLIALLLRRGIAIDDTAEWVRGAEMDRLLTLVAAPPGATYSPAEAAAHVGLSEELVQAFAEALDLGTHAAAPVLLDEDLEALRIMKPALDIGLSEQALLQLARVFADAMRRIAEAEAHFFHFYIRRTLDAQGLEGGALNDAMQEAGDHLNPISDPALAYFHRRALRHAVADTTAMAVAERLGLHRVEGAQDVHVAIAFVDLASFTPLTEAMGDEQAAEVLARFSTLVRHSCRDHDGHVAKQIGDAFMIVFPNAAAAVQGVLSIERHVSDEEHFPAIRSGINVGPARYHEGDYVGTTVNVAARLADAAGRHQILVGPDVRREARGLERVVFRPTGAQRLKGLSEPIEIYEVTATDRTAPDRLVDPVCGMELSPDEVSVRLSSGGDDLAFCSEECLRRYVARSA